MSPMPTISRTMQDISETSRIMDAAAIMQDTSNHHDLGWNKDAFFNLMVAFIDENGHETEFRTFVNRKADDESLMSGGA